MKALFTDASLDWTSTEKNGENVVRGKIAISDGNSFERIDKVAVGKVEGLRQYINIFELTAIARAVERASEENPKAEALTIFTDSQTAMHWARNNRINPKVATVAHRSALEYLNRACIRFGGAVTFNYVPRDQNPAGKLLENELEHESPHAT
mgnify:CR=1 FL=1